MTSRLITGNFEQSYIIPNKKCAQCDNAFVSHGVNHVCCSQKCRSAKYLASNPNIGYIKKHFDNCDVSATGAIQELRVCVDLMKRGYDVFRAVSPTTSCDIIAKKNGVVIEFEVRSGRFNNKTNKLYFVKKTSDVHNYAVVLNDKIVYVPEIL